MRKIRISVSLTVLIALAITGAVLAQGSPPGSGWWSGEQIQNVGTGPATVNVTAYNSNGDTYATDPETVPEGGSTTFLPADFADMPGSFQGSAVVTASNEIRAIVNVTNRQGGSYGVSGGLAAGQYQGMNQGALTLNFPLAKNNYFSKTTTFYIQNAGTASATATATFKIGGSSYTYTTPSMLPGTMVAFGPSDATPTPPSGDTAVGSMTVSSSQPLAGVVLEHKTFENPATLLQATRGFTNAEADTILYAPIIKNNFFNRFTGLQVQNVSGGPVNVTVTYKASSGCSGTYTDQTTGLADGASHTFVHSGTSTNLPTNCLAGAKVVATGDVVAIVNESYTSAAVAAGRNQESTTYSAFSSSAATNLVQLPLAKEDSFNKGTGVQIQNVSSSSTASVVVTYTGPTGTYTSVAQSIAPGGALTLANVRLKPASFWNGTAMTPAALGCSSTPPVGCGSNGVFGVKISSNQPVVSIANESTYPFTAPRISQDKNNYEGFNLAP
jgi:hypothetical protein